MKVFMAEDNFCAQSLLKLVSHGNAIMAEILRLKDHIPIFFNFENKEIQLKYQDILLDFSYFKISDNQEKKISGNMKLQDLDDDIKENSLDLVIRFYSLFDNIYQYVIDLNILIDQLNDEVVIQQNIHTVLKDVEGKQLLCESIHLYGAMLLLCDMYIPGHIRERLLVAYYRYSTDQSQSNVENVCKLLRDTGYNQLHGKRPSDYPVEYFGRVPLNTQFVDKVIGKLRSEDIYNQLAVYTIPEHRSAALATQGSMLFITLFFSPNYLHSESTIMTEIVNKFFSCNWIIPTYMGVTINIVDYWDNFKAAKMALNSAYNTKLIKDIFGQRGSSVDKLILHTRQLLKQGILTDDYVLNNISKILNLVVNANFVLRVLLLHNNKTMFFDNNRKSKQLKELVQKESNYNSSQILELLINTAELELNLRDRLKRLFDNRNETWTTSKQQALEAVSNLSQLFSGLKPVTKIQQNEQLKLWFENVFKQITSLSDEITTKSMKKIVQLIQALDEVEEFHGIKSTSTVLQYLNECKDSLKNALKAASLKEEFLVTLETVTDVSYAWCIIDSYVKCMQDRIKNDPTIISRLRALFLKLTSAMEIPLLRINQAQSEDLISVCQYYSSELIKYIQKVLQIIPEMVFNIVEKIINLQTWTIKEVPTRLEKEYLRDFAQLDHRMEVAKLTHSASTFTTGILDMRSTLVGVIRVDPAELLEKGLLNELAINMNSKFEELLDAPAKKTPFNSNNLMPRLQKLSESMNGYKRSLEYIQDYINIHGLKIWQKQIYTIISDSVNKEISIRKGVTLHSPSAGFMGSLARQLYQLADARLCSYLRISCAWFDTKSQNEVINNKTFVKLYEAIGAVGLHGLDTLYAFMIKNQLQNFILALKNSTDKQLLNVNLNDEQFMKTIDQVVNKSNKFLNQLSEIVVIIGTLQLLRKHIAYQLNTSCKFDSSNLETTLQAVNDAILKELKSTEDPDKIKDNFELVKCLENYLTRCGICEPLEKVYLTTQECSQLNNIGNIFPVLFISQLQRLTECRTTGDLITKKPGDNIDGYPLLLGLYTILMQSKKVDNEYFIDILCKYTRHQSLNNLRTKSMETADEASYVVKILEMYCDAFQYPFSNIENKLPTAILIPTK